MHIFATAGTSGKTLFLTTYAGRPGDLPTAVGGKSMLISRPRSDARRGESRWNLNCPVTESIRLLLPWPGFLTVDGDGGKRKIRNVNLQRRYPRPCSHGGVISASRRAIPRPSARITSQTHPRNGSVPKPNVAVLPAGEQRMGTTRQSELLPGPTGKRNCSLILPVVESQP